MRLAVGRAAASRQARQFQPRSVYSESLLTPRRSVWFWYRPDEAKMDERGDSRWAERNGAKAAIRERVWSGLAEAQVNIGPVFDRIPNFVGADVAAKRLSELDEWRRARVVKCNPDPPQIPVRLRALYDGKLLFSPVPYLSRDFPYLRIDPDKLAAKGVDFETAATAQGLME